MRDLHNLDLLRAFAVLLVLVDHNALALDHQAVGRWQFNQLGLAGVTLFFVHTSLVLMWSLERKPHVLNFYIRRVFRIYPLAIAAILAALLSHLPVDVIGPVYPAPTHFGVLTILTNLLLIQDLAGQPAIVGVTWSLSCEVAMYVALPALFFLAAQERRIWHFMLLWGLSAAWAWRSLHGTGNIVPTVIPLFIPGVIAYIGFRKVSARLAPALFPLFLFTLTLLYMLRPGMWGEWCLALATGLSLPFFRQIAQPALVTTVRVIARYSYGIYLWHTFGFRLAFHHLASSPATLRVAAELLFTAVASVLTYHLIEEPFIRLGNRVAQKEDANRPVFAVL